MNGQVTESNIYIGTPEEIERRMTADVSRKVYDYQFLEFATHRKAIARLSLSEKMAWYACQNPQELISLGNNKEFRRFWYWRVLLPIKVKRFYYRLKNRELFKHYDHISEIRQREMAPKVKKYSI